MNTMCKKAALSVKHKLWQNDKETCVCNVSVRKTISEKIIKYASYVHGLPEAWRCVETTTHLLDDTPDYRDSDNIYRYGDLR